MSRRDSRIAAMETVYQMELGIKDPQVSKDKALRPDDEFFAEELLMKESVSRDDMKDKINDRLKEWTFDRLGVLEKSILLLGFAEMAFFEGIPLNVSLDEWVDIAKDYCGEEAKKLINGVLHDYKNLLLTEGVRVE